MNYPLIKRLNYFKRLIILLILRFIVNFSLSQFVYQNKIIQFLMR